jgi:phenylpropionate dioxygenase-like ring-hydroxylating dioxygenase large terminal subunit
MYINFWYPVCTSEELSDKPIRVRLLKHDLVAFRGKGGTAAVLSDTCIHRGGSLAGGKCKDDGTIQCPYHGWRFTAAGDCTRIPSLGILAAIPPRAKVDAYPVVERYGLVFAFIGDLAEAERPPIMPIPEYGTAGWRATVVSLDVDYNYERSIENGLDAAHTEFVHPSMGYQGEREQEYKVNELVPHLVNEWGSGFMSTFDSPPSKNWLMRRFRKAGGKTQAGSGTHGPNQMWTFIHFTATKFMHQYLFEAPMEENRTRVFLVNLRNVGVTGWEWLNRRIDSLVNAKNLEIAGQDVVVVNKLAPVLTPSSRTKELLMPHDSVILQYRDFLARQEAKGWKLDHLAVNAAHAKGDVVYALPSPGRRTAKGWVLDPAPVIAPPGVSANAAPQVMAAE